MNKSIALLALFFTSLIANAQDTLNTPMLTVGYFGGIPFEPGVTAGVQWPQKAWSTEKTKGEQTRRVYKYLIIHPRVAVFSRKHSYTGVLIHADLGYRRQREGRKSFSQVALGLGYNARFSITSFTVNFSGEIIDRERERQDIIVPTISYTYGRNTPHRFDWYTRIAYGNEIRLGNASAGALFLELGLQMNLSKY